MFVPVRPSSSRSSWASEVPTCAPPISYSWPLTLRRRSLTARHRQHVREMDEARARARDQPRVLVVLRLRQRPPQILGGDEQLPDLLELLAVAVALVRRVEREAE